MEYFLTVKKNNESTPVFSTDSPVDIGHIHTVMVDKVDGSRLFDAYTVSLKAKNEFDESYSYDSYQVTKNGTEKCEKFGNFEACDCENCKNHDNSEIICALLDADGDIKTVLNMTNNDARDENPQITSAVFPDGIERFVLGWNTENVLRLSAINSEGDIYTDFAMEIGNAADTSNYSGFRFVKGAENIEEPDIKSAVSENIYKDSLWGIKLIKESFSDDESDYAITASGKQRLLELDEQNTADSFDACLSSDDSKEISFAMLLTDHSTELSPAKLAIAKAGYKNELVVDEPYFSYEDVLPGLDMPVLFRIQNAGV